MVPLLLPRLPRLHPLQLHPLQLHPLPLPLHLEAQHLYPLHLARARGSMPPLWHAPSPGRAMWTSRQSRRLDHTAEF